MVTGSAGHWPEADNGPVGRTGMADAGGWVNDPFGASTAATLPLGRNAQTVVSAVGVLAETTSQTSRTANARSGRSAVVRQAPPPTSGVAGWSDPFAPVSRHA